MQKITPCLWFDDQAEEAVNFYVSIFTQGNKNLKNSKVMKVMRYDEESAKASGRPEGSILTISFMLNVQEYLALNGGPVFKFNPSLSFFVNCETEKEIDKLWEKLSESKTEIFWQLQSYPWSEKYGWLIDKFGVSWQLNLTRSVQQISPFLSFFGNQYGIAEEAINFYMSVFPNSKTHYIARYSIEEEKHEGTIKHAVFSINGQEFKAMESSKQLAEFNEAISFIINCETQSEVDYYWTKLSEGGDEKAQQCGWLKDKYGLSWQIVPTILDKLLTDKNPEKSKRAMHALLQMKKIDIAGLKLAYEQQ